MQIGMLNAWAHDEFREQDPVPFKKVAALKSPSDKVVSRYGGHHHSIRDVNSGLSGSGITRCILSGPNPRGHLPRC